MAQSGQGVYSIGHSNHRIEAFLALLKRHCIEVVVDTRSQPHSRFNPQFNRRALQASLAQEGIDYEYLGDRLGGRPRDPGLYDDQGYVLYGRIAQTADFQAAIESLKKVGHSRRIALLCSEENPSVCHRRLLIGRALFDQGAPVLHIRGDGRLETESELRSMEQPHLFASDEDWKSPKPIRLTK